MEVALRFNAMSGYYGGEGNQGVREVVYFRMIWFKLVRGMRVIPLEILQLNPIWGTYIEVMRGSFGDIFS